MTRRFFAAAFVAAICSAGSADAQGIQPCPAPARLPPANSPTLLRCMQLVAHPINETLVDGATYDFYIRTPRTNSAEGRWVPFSEQSIQSDFNSLWRTNFLDNLWIETIDEPYENGVMGKHVIFHIEERARVKSVDYRPLDGGKLPVEVSKIDSTLKERNIEMRLDSFVDEATIRRVSGVIRELAADQGFNDARIEPVTREVPGGYKLVELHFNIDSGPKVEIEEVVFDGNSALSDGDLRAQMKDNKPKSWSSVISDAGTFHETKFADDAERVAEHYRTKGYAAVQIGNPQHQVVSTSVDGKTRRIRVRIPVEEGPRFTVGKFEIVGDTTLKADALRELFKIKEGDQYDIQKIRKGFEKVKEVYGTYGFWQWAPEPEFSPRGVDPATSQPVGSEPPPPIMDITLRMNEGKQFFVNRITFQGNTTTHDAVIRRELRLAEGAVFNTEALKESVRRLNQLGYFKPLEGGEGEMEVVPTPGSDNKVDVKLKVEEQNRNQLSFGAGVSQFEGFFGQLSFQTANFLGRGETVGVSLQKGSQARQYQISFTEPYLFDRPINVGLDIHSRQFIYPLQFTQESTGGNLVLGLPLADYTRLFLGYSYEQVRVFDINELYTVDQLQPGSYLYDALLQGQGGRRKVSKISPSVVFNTVNQPLFPTAGRRFSVTTDLAGGILGGNTDYVQEQVEGIWYVPLAPRHSLGMRAQAGYIRPYGRTTTLPIFEKLFLGGEYNIRGFDSRTVSPRDSQTGVLTGGNKSLVFNVEYYVDLLAGKLRLVGFYDAGQVQDLGTSFSWKQDVLRLVQPELPFLVDFLINPNFLSAPGAIHTEVAGRASSFQTSTGLEVRFFMPVLNIPFRLISSYNPQRNGILNSKLVQTPKFTFRFAVGTMF